jgi:hypothetical protein
MQNVNVGSGPKFYLIFNGELVFAVSLIFCARKGIGKAILLYLLSTMLAFNLRFQLNLQKIKCNIPKIVLEKRSRDNIKILHSLCKVFVDNSCL